MTCDRYWSEGILLAEQGQPDAHRETCADCQRAHARRAELVGVLPLVDAMRTGNPRWKQGVWREVDRVAQVRRAWWIGGSLVTAAAAALVLWLAVRPPAAATRLEIELVSGPVAMRSQTARVGDTMRVNPRHGEEVRFYRARRLLARCAAGAPQCQIELRTAGDYQIVIIDPGAPPPAAQTLDGDIAAVVSSGGNYRIVEQSVR
jgi:hypothetical protein